MAKTQKKRVLFLGHDNLLEHVEELDVDFLGVFGRSMGRTKEQFRRNTPTELARSFWRLVTRQYDQVIFPSALLTRAAETGGSWFKRALSTLLFRFSYCDWLTALCRRITGFILPKRPTAFVERFSQMTLQRPLFQYFPKSIVFKTIADRSYPERELVRVVPMPYWINVDCYPPLELVPLEERSIDVFYAGATVFDQRLVAPRLEKLSKEAGIDFQWLRERLDFESFVRRLADSKIAWSPEGSNWQCWRHYEALYYGAVPLINRPDSRIYQTLVEGETCFLYDSPEEAVELMVAICKGDLRLSLTEAERREFVIEGFSADGAGRFIARELGLIEKGPAGSTDRAARPAISAETC